MIIDVAERAGAVLPVFRSSKSINPVSYSCIIFTVSNPNKYLSKALQQAINSVNTKADELAKVTGIRLGDAYKVSYVYEKWDVVSIEDLIEKFEKGKGPVSTCFETVPIRATVPMTYAQFVTTSKSK